MCRFETLTEYRGLFRFLRFCVYVSEISNIFIKQSSIHFSYQILLHFAHVVIFDSIVVASFRCQNFSKYPILINKKNCPSCKFCVNLVYAEQLSRL